MENVLAQKIQSQPTVTRSKLQQISVTSQQRDTLASLFIITSAWLLFFGRMIFLPEAERLTFQQGDFTLQFLAYRQLAYRQLREGRFPVIEECLYAGHPFQADPQSQVLYPPVLASMALGLWLGWEDYPLRALEWEVMLHVLVAALNTFAFLSHTSPTPKPPAALIGSLAFAFGGFLTGYPLLQTSILQTACWLPLLLLCARKLMGQQRWTLQAIALAGTTYLALTAGHPQTLLMCAYAVAAYGIFQAWRARLSMRDALMRGAAALLLSASLSAAQLLPSTLFVLNSTRLSLTIEQAGRGFALHDVVLFFTPGFSNIWQPLYVGVIGLALMTTAVAFCGAWRSSDVLFWVALGSVALLLSFGANAIGFDLAYWMLPGYRQFQSQERHALVVSFSAAMLASRASAVLLGPISESLQRWFINAAKWWAAIGVLGMSVTVALLAANAAAGGLLGQAANRIAWLGAGCFVAALLLAWRAVSKPSVRKSWGFVAAIVLAVDLLSSNRANAFQPYAPPFTPNPLIIPISETINLKQFSRVYNHYGLPLNGACIAGLNEVSGGSPIVWRDYSTFLEKAPEAVLVRMLNARYGITWRGAMETPEGVVIPWFLLARDTFESKPASTYRLDWEPGDFNGAWIAPEVVRVEEEEAIYAAMRKPGYDPFHTAFVLNRDWKQFTFGGTGNAAVEGKATGYMKIAAFADAQALLVLSESYHPNWVAIVNGQVQTPLRVNGALLGVAIPAGQTTVEMSYQPRDLYVGAAISATTLIAMCIALLLHHRWQCK